MEKIYLITGAAGHLASVLIKKLKDKGCKMRGLILPNEKGISDNQITYFTGDVTKKESLTEFFSSLEGFEIILIHLAAIISIQDKVSPAVYDVNVNGTMNIIEKCKEYNVKRLLYVSSVHAIPEPDKITMIKEVDHFSKDLVDGAYAMTKAEASQLVLDAEKTGLDVVIVHPSGITGPGDLGRNHLTQLMQMYLHHKLPMGVTGGYDFVDVRDVADGIILATEKGKKGECYLLSNRYVPIPELLECMRLATGRKNKKLCCPLWIAKLVAPIGEAFAKIMKKRPVFTSYSLKTMEANGHYCHDKATMELGYSPRDIKYTIADTINYLKLHNA